MTTDALSSRPADVVAVTAAAADRADLLEQAIVIPDVEWDQYVALRDKPANHGLWITYAEGVLEIMTLSSFHELITSDSITVSLGEDELNAK